MNLLKSMLVSSLMVIGFTGTSYAALINFDFEAGFGVSNDPFSTGGAVFGTASSQWNVLERTGRYTNLVLNNDTGATTSVTLTTNDVASGFNSTSGSFADLGYSHQWSSLVTIGSLAAGSLYDLVVYANDGQTSDWSTLVEGTHYKRYDGIQASGSGEVTFVPWGVERSPGEGSWTAFQLRDSAAVPLPAAIWLFGSALLGLIGVARRKKAA